MLFLQVFFCSLISPSCLMYHSFFFSRFSLFLIKVAGIVGRADLLCALFFQLSFLTYCKAFNKGRYLTRVLLFRHTVILYCTKRFPYVTGIKTLSICQHSMHLSEHLHFNPFLSLSSVVLALCSQGVTEMTGFLSSGLWSASCCVLQQCSVKNKASLSWYEVLL